MYAVAPYRIKIFEILFFILLYYICFNPCIHVFYLFFRGFPEFEMTRPDGVKKHGLPAQPVIHPSSPPFPRPSANA